MNSTAETYLDLQIELLHDDHRGMVGNADRALKNLVLRVLIALGTATDVHQCAYLLSLTVDLGGGLVVEQGVVDGRPEKNGVARVWQ